MEGFTDELLTSVTQQTLGLRLWHLNFSRKSHVRVIIPFFVLCLNKMLLFRK